MLEIKSNDAESLKFVIRGTDDTLDIDNLYIFEAENAIKYVSDFEKIAKDHSETESQTEEPTEQEKEEEKDTKTVGTQSLRLLPHSQWMEGSEGTAAKSCDVWL